MKIFTNCKKIELRESPIEGVGVFATEDIKAGEVLEEVPFITFPRYTTLAKNIFDVLRKSGWVSSKEVYMDNLRENCELKEPERYYFKWHPKSQLDSDSMFTVLPLGFGCCYNTSNTDNNADWKIGSKTFTFTASRDIKKDEEIKTFYGYYLAEDGSIYNCEDVFYFAIDMFDVEGSKQHRVKAFRFGSIETYSKIKNHPAFMKMHEMILKSKDGLRFEAIFLYKNSGDQNPISVVINKESRLSEVYNRLRDCKFHSYENIAFVFSYTDTGTGEVKTEKILLRK